jgi:hypothetical protein
VVVQWNYVNPRQALWPSVDFIVGNPPFIGNKRMRDALGSGYVDALRMVWSSVPESADYVMYWWQRAAETVRTGAARRFGLITTNSLTMIFNRRVVEAQQSASPPLSVVFAIPDHPWVDSADGAAVRIAMTVGVAGAAEGRLLTSTEETEADNGEIAVRFGIQQGVIHADLKVGANVASAVKLQSNFGLSSMGMMRAGAGFLLTEAEARSLGLGEIAELDQRIRPFRNGRDLTDRPRGLWLIDLFGLSSDEVRQTFPSVFQWVLERVKPERDVNRRDRLREKWWIFGEPRQGLRAALKGLPRYIATVETAKHRAFVFLDTTVLPDHKLVAIASSDALHLGILSSQVHALWALAAGGTLEDRPVYSKSRCFDTFPFPDASTGLTPDLTQRICTRAEQIDAHRKAQQAAYPDVTLTGMYNVLEKLRSGEALTPSERTMNEHGLVAVLRTLHDELDAAVLAAYGWNDLTLPADTDTLLQRLVELNAKRAAEESAGTVRWLRPEFQKHANAGQQAEMEVETGSTEEVPPAVPTPAPATKRPWPSGLPEQIKTVAEVLAATPQPLTLAALEAHFTARGRWRDRLPTILETLEALGRARRISAETPRWKSA